MSSLIRVISNKTRTVVSLGQALDRRLIVLTGSNSSNILRPDHSINRLSQAQTLSSSVTWYRTLFVNSLTDKSASPLFLKSMFHETQTIQSLNRKQKGLEMKPNR